MAPYSDDDPYLDELTGVLKNRLGITGFDLKHLKTIHKHLFGDV